MAASQSRAVHSKIHRVCPIHTRNIGPIGPISSTIPSPWIQPLPKGTSDMPWMIKKINCTRKMAGSQSRTVYSKTHMVCPNHTRNIGPVGLISSTIPSPWIESLPKGRFDMPWLIQRATVPGKWLRPNHVRYIQRPTGSVLSTHLICSKNEICSRKWVLQQKKQCSAASCHFDTFLYLSIYNIYIYTIS